MNKVAICVHDLKLSSGNYIIQTINYIRNRFNEMKVTFHIVIDIDIDINTLQNNPTLLRLRPEVWSGDLEIVFHGTTHQTIPPGAWRWLRWYHKDEAEFISPSFNQALNTSRFKDLNQLLYNNPPQAQTPYPQSQVSSCGFCPSCWIASKNGWRFIKSLMPEYRERLFSMKFIDRKWFFSVPLSIATINTAEMTFLGLFVLVASRFTGIFRRARTRLVIHEVDLNNPVSMAIFLNAYNKLINRRRFTPVLLRDLRQ